MRQYTKRLQEQHGSPPYTQYQIAQAILEQYYDLLRYGYIVTHNDSGLTLDDIKRVELKLDKADQTNAELSSMDIGILVLVDNVIVSNRVFYLSLLEAMDYAAELQAKLYFYKHTANDHPIQYPIPEVKDTGELIYHNPHFVFYEERFSTSRNPFEKGWCDLRIYQKTSPYYNVLVITEPIDSKGEYMNDGQSVVNGVENIIFTLKYLTDRLVGKDNQNIVPTWDYYIEYLPPRGKTLEPKRSGHYFPEEFAVVNIVNGQPEWKFMSRDDVEDLIGMPFVYVPEK